MPARSSFVVLIGRSLSGHYRIRYANNAFVEAASAAGLVPSDPQSLLGALHDADRSRLLTSIDNMLSGAEGLDFNCRIETPRLSCWISLSLHAFMLDGERAVLMIAETAMQQGARFTPDDVTARIVQESQDGIAVFELPTGDPSQRKTIYVNEALSRILGVSAEYLLVNGSAHIVFGPNRVQERVAVGIAASGVPWRGDVQAHLPNGKRKWLNVSVYPIMRDLDTCERFAVFYRDIEEERRKEQRLSLLTSILDEASDFVIISDMSEAEDDGPRIVYVNRSFAAFMGVSEKALLGLPVMSLHSARNDRKRIESIVRGVQQQTVIAQEILLRRFDGTERWIEFTARPFKDDQGNPIAWFAVAKDIAIRKRQLKQTAELLLALDCADEPIAIFSVDDGMNLSLEYVNRVAERSPEPLLMRMLRDPAQRIRITSTWPSLEAGSTVQLLAATDPQGGALAEWRTLELRPLLGVTGTLDSVVAIEHPLCRGTCATASPVSMALSLSAHILRYATFEERRDALSELLMRQWKAGAEFQASETQHELLVHIAANEARASIPAGILFEPPAEVTIRWSHPMASSDRTALRILMETLGAPQFGGARPATRSERKYSSRPRTASNKALP